MVMKTSKLSLGGCRGSEASWDFPSYVKRWTWSEGEAAALYPQNLQKAPDLQLRWDQSLLQNATRQDPSCKKWWEDSGLQRQEHGATLLQQDMLTQVIFSGHWKIGKPRCFHHDKMTTFASFIRKVQECLDDLFKVWRLVIPPVCKAYRGYIVFVPWVCAQNIPLIDHWCHWTKRSGHIPAQE